jgi:hypothetical protein
MQVTHRHRPYVYVILAETVDPALQRGRPRLERSLRFGQPAGQGRVSYVLRNLPQVTY